MSQNASKEVKERGNSVNELTKEQNVSKIKNHNRHQKRKHENFDEQTRTLAMGHHDISSTGRSPEVNNNNLFDAISGITI